MNFEEEWVKKGKILDLEKSRKFWDLRAQEFNEIGKRQNKNDDLLNVLKSKGAIYKGAKVLDIGCGAGRYSKEFLKMGCEVVGIDLSNNMIEFAKENSSHFQERNFVFKVMSWEETNLEKEGWKNYFDLVFASMSPAINSPKALKKMIGASKGFCYMSSHLIKEDRIGMELKAILNQNGKEKEYPNSLYYAFNILWQMGYIPEFYHQDNSREKTWEVEKAIHYYEHMLRAENHETKNIIRNYIKRNSINGFIEDFNKSKQGRLIWSI